MSIRPVSSRFPCSEAIWKETSLPLCAILTPFEDMEEEDGEAETDGGDDNKNKNRNTVQSNKNHKKEMVRYRTFAQPIAAVPKCLYCGAPHPTATTHYRPSKLSSRLLCYLCGETSSTLITDQQEVREDEHLDPDVYDKIPFELPEDEDKGEEDSEDDDEDDEDDDEDNEDEDEDKESMAATDCVEFRVPIGVRKVPKKVPARNSGRKKGKRRHSKTSKEKKYDTVETWQLPAMACPPVWWIVVDGTVGSTPGCRPDASRNYWITVGNTLSRALEDIPPHVHVGLITATGSRLASWDLASAIPHVKHYPYAHDPADALEGEEDGDDGGDDEVAGTPWDLCLVPANGHYKANLEAAIRAMVDAAGSGVFAYGDDETQDDEIQDEKKDDGDEDEDDPQIGRNVPLALTLEIILDFMGQATHPGQEVEGEAEVEDGMSKLRYAGGKILCLLGNPPLETAIPPGDDSPSYIGQPDYGYGGVGGSCSALEDDGNERSSSFRNASARSLRSENEEEGTDPSDMTASNLNEYTLPLDPQDMFLKIGSRCASAALGVDLFVLVPEEDEVKNDRFGRYTQPQVPWYGLPLLRPLLDASGAPGPLMFGTANSEAMEDDDASASEGKSDSNKHIEKFERLHENILARTPWQSDMAFGVCMRLRISPGFKLETKPLVTESKEAELNQANFLFSRGLSGPAVVASTDSEDAVAGSEDEMNTGMWIMGTCDSQTSFNVDIETDGADELPTIGEMPGDDDDDEDENVEVDLKPVLQTCSLFTCIETDGAEPTPNYYTVCKMRVSSVALEFADNTEDIYDGLDLEALSTVLFHKTQLEAYIDGLVPAQESVEAWLQMAMGSLYRSALEEYELLEEENEQETSSDEESHDGSESIRKPNPNFVPGDRLVNLEEDEAGELEETDILLGQGHNKAHVLPLLVYGIMNSDALRPCGGSYQPSMDARLCAMTQMASMSPRNMARLLSPSLSLWSIKEDQPIMESLPLSRESVLGAIEEIEDYDPEDMVLLLDSLQRVLLFRIDELDVGPASSVSLSIKIGPALRAAIAEAIEGFRTAPLQWRAMERFLENDGGDLNDIRVPRSVLFSMLLEDSNTTSGDRDFAEWKSSMAEAIKEAVGENDGEEEEPPGRLQRLLPFLGRN
mmetsp:Transcript_10492/g.30669  ORF Transcript_10492/g.30669 Transcript_10492/m.30669 type:complete len:1140 (-) Transcript_10492:275-3694(-)